MKNGYFLLVVLLGLCLTLSAQVFAEQDGGRPGGGRPTGGFDADGRPRGFRPGGHFQPREISRWIDKLRGEVDRFRQLSRPIGDANLNGFVNELDRFDYSLQDIRNRLDSGYDACLGHMKNMTRDFSTLEGNFQRNFGTYRVTRVRLAWLQIKIAYLEVEYSLTGGDPVQ